MKTKDHKVADRLVEFFGTPANAATALKAHSAKMSRQLVSTWVRQGYIPARWAPTIEQATGGKISALEVMETAVYHSSGAKPQQSE